MRTDLRSILVFALFAMVSSSAVAQISSAQIDVPGSIVSGVPFTVRVTIVVNCPPPSEVPPPVFCVSLLGSFQVSDPSATFPTPVVILPNQTISVPGFFVFNQRRPQTIALKVDGIGVVGTVAFFVQAPAAAAVPTLGWWQILVLTIFIVIFAVAVPNLGFNLTSRKRAAG
jgi:hypothetical protein